MDLAVTPVIDTERLAALARREIIDALPTAMLDDFVALAACLCATPVAVISLIDSNRRWFGGGAGLPVLEAVYQMSLCSQSGSLGELFEVPDAGEHDQFRSFAHVDGQPHIRFYASMPLLISDGSRVGTLCVADTAPRNLQPPQRSGLKLLARQAAQLMERNMVAGPPDLSPLHGDRFFTLPLDLLAIFGADGYFKRINPSFSETLGYSRAALLSRPLVEFVHPEDLSATLAEMKKLGEGQRVVDFENRFQCFDGTWKWFSWRAYPFTDEGLFYATARDITRRKTLEVALRKRNAELGENQTALLAAREAAEHANRAKSTFLATMSHEIRTPLNGMFGMLELLSLSKLDEAQQAKLKLVRDSGIVLLRIIDDILDFSKIEAQKLDLWPEPVSIRHLIATVVETYAGNAGSKGLLLAHHCDADISPVLLVDPMRLRQILNNLVSNAVKFTPRGGSIELRAELIDRADGNELLHITVADSGIGISLENQKHLFQPFSQADGSTTRLYGGTGLGLTISRRLAALMGGSVSMHSEPDKGTRMLVSLPLRIAAPRAVGEGDDGDKGNEGDERDASGAASHTSPPERGAARSINEALADGTLVLLVDDHPTNLDVLMRQIEVLGYAAEGAADGIAALTMWQSGRFGAVITDCHMPGMNGYELATNIRRLESGGLYPHTPIIACTANALAGEAEVCLAAGMDDYMAKPITLGQLQQKLLRWLPAGSERGGKSIPGPSSRSGPRA